MMTGACLLALGCATTGSDLAEEEPVIEMRAVEQPVAGTAPVGESDLPPIDLVEHGETRIAAFGLG